MIRSPRLSSIIISAALGALLLVAGCDPGTGGATAGAGAVEESPAAPAAIGAEPGAQVAGPPVGVPDPAEQAARIEKAHRLLEEMARAYRAAPAFEDRVVVEGTMGGSAVPTTEFTIRLGSGTDFYQSSGAMTITAVDGKVYIENRASPDRYLAYDLEGDALATLLAKFGKYQGIMAQAALRYGKPYEEIVYTISFGCRDTTRIDNYRRITDTDGRELEQILLISGSGSVAVNVDPQTKFIVSADVEYAEPFAPVPNWVIKRHHVFNPKAGAALSEPIAFDTAGRHQVHCSPLLLGKQDSTCPVTLAFGLGEKAPDFRLSTLRGEWVQLSDLRGVPVVIAFWQGFDAGSLKMLPQLELAHRRAQERGKTVAFYAINTHSLPREPDPEAQWEQAFDLWDDAELTIPALIDPSREVIASWGMLGIPTTVVLDADGVLVETIGGIDEATFGARLDRAIDAVAEPGG